MRAGGPTPDDTTPASTTPSSTTLAPPATTAPLETSEPAPGTGSAGATATGAPCTPEALGAAHAAKYGAADVAVIACESGWASASAPRGLEGPLFVLYQDVGGTWVALNRGLVNVCAGYGVRDDVAPRIGCDS